MFAQELLFSSVTHFNLDDVFEFDDDGHGDLL